MANSQPVSGGQLGTGMAYGTTRLRLPVTGAVGFVVNALARIPANTTEKIDVCIMSFILWLPPNISVPIWYSGS
jgi:hypothetical protein